jgi:hypothetical protein
MSKLNEQFDVLSNTLRLLPEEFMRLNYFITKVNDPEEGISNIEIACVNVFNNIYGMMCALKDEGAVTSIYKHDAITTILCIRHILQHQSGRIRNNLRDSFLGNINEGSVLVEYSTSNPNMLDSFFYINVDWFQQGIANSKNPKRLGSINEFWMFDQIKGQIESSPNCSWDSTYVCVMALITEAVRTILVKYGSFISVSGFDSSVYYEHFKNIDPINAMDYEIIHVGSQSTTSTRDGIANAHLH